jgi:hypothetical protein
VALSSLVCLQNKYRQKKNHYHAKFQVNGLVLMLLCPHQWLDMTALSVVTPFPTLVCKLAWKSKIILQISLQEYGVCMKGTA